jgi:hypothetical protein
LTTSETEAPDILRICMPAGKMLARIKADGEVEYGEGYEPNEAARIFWAALAHYAPPTFTAEELTLVQNWANVAANEWGLDDDEQALSDRIDAGHIGTRIEFP